MKKLVALVLFISFVFSLPCALSEGPKITNKRAAGKATSTPAPVAACTNNGLMLTNPITFFGGAYTYNGSSAFTAQDMENILWKAIQSGGGCTTIFSCASENDVNTYINALIASNYFTMESNANGIWRLRYTSHEKVTPLHDDRSHHLEIFFSGNDKMVLLFSPDFILSTTDGSKVTKPTATPAPTATPKPTAVPTDKPTATPKPASSYNVTYSGNTTYLVQDAEKLFASLEPFSDVLTTDRKTYTKVAYYTEEYGLVESLAALYKEALESYSSMELTASITDKYSSQWYIYTLPNASSDDKFSYSITRSGSGEKDYQGSLFITYNPDGTKIQFYMAKSLSVKDLGLRVSASQIEKLSNLGYEDDSSSSSASSSSNSSSTTHKREKNCPKVDCNNGKVSCSNCSGRGYKEKTVSSPNYSGKGVKYETVKENCYRCHGSGDVDCSSCGGDGKVEY